METQHEFIERRRLGHAQAAIEAENDPLIKALFGPHEETAISERMRRDYCLPPGWLFRRQAGEPLDAPVSSGDTVTAVTESREPNVSPIAAIVGKPRVSVHVARAVQDPSGKESRPLALACVDPLDRV